MPLVLVPCHVLLFENPSIDIANFGGNFIQSLSKGFLNSQHFFTSIWLPLNEACAPPLQINNLLKNVAPFDWRFDLMVSRFSDDLTFSFIRNTLARQPNTKKSTQAGISSSGSLKW